MALQRDKKTPNVVATERLLHARSLRGIIWTRTVMKNYGSKLRFYTAQGPNPSSLGLLNRRLRPRFPEAPPQED
jgi:hypothetical protein